MNREIKFRGRDVITGNWAYGFYYPSNGHSIIRNENDAECIVMPSTVGQLTGLLDKNGKEIYEGDILDCGQDETFIVQYFADTASFVAYGSETGKVRWIETRENFRSDFQINPNDSEVIGNIYELLK